MTGDRPGPGAAAPPAAGTLVLRGLTKRFGGVTALAGLDLEVPPGSALAIIGPNGAGKSTVLKLVAGTYAPTHGSVHLGSTRLDRLPPHAVPRAGVALANQVPRPFRGLSVRDNVRLGTHVATGEQALGVEEVLETCALSGKADRLVGDLGLLDLKRLEVARSLATDPAVLLLDEIAAGLVGRELDQAVELVRGVHATGRTVVLVEHVEGVVRSLVERVVVLDWGRVIATGTPAQVAADPTVRAVYLGTPDEDPRPGSAGHQGVGHQGTGHASARAPATTSPSPPSADGAARGLADGSEGGPALPPGTAEEVLALRGVSAAYGSVAALRGVDVSVARGQVVAVLGANGAGKSTLCSVASGIVAATGGTTWLQGRDVTRAPAFRRTRAGLAHCREGRKLFAALSVRENLDLGAGLGVRASLTAQRRERVLEVFPALRGRLAAAAGTLSGGQQQMVAIGRALMSQPSVLVCDEVSLGLAPVAIDALYESLVAVNAAGTAILLVEQSVERCLRIATRAYVLDRGSISYDGEPAPLLDPAVLDAAYFGAGSAA